MDLGHFRRFLANFSTKVIPQQPRIIRVSKRDLLTSTENCEGPDGPCQRGLATIKRELEHEYVKGT